MLYLCSSSLWLSGLSTFFTELMKGMGASSRLWQLCDRQPSIPITGEILAHSCPPLPFLLSLACVSLPFESHELVPVLLLSSCDVKSALTHTHTHTHTHRREAALPSWCYRRRGGRVSQRYRFESRRGEWALFSLIPSALSFVFL